MPNAAARPTLDFDDEKARFVREVEHALVAFLEKKKQLVAEISPESLEMVEAARDLLLRGGKRFRPLIAYASFRSVADQKPPIDLAHLGACLEMLQNYLLIHDDWMDQDIVRRGGPAVHAFFSQRYGDAHLGASLGVLSGDLCCTWAWEMFQQINFPSAARQQAQNQFARMQTEVYCGQHLDLTGSSDVQRMHLLKTASYSTVSPALLGALLADANSNQLNTLQDWALAVGEAFQLRDDLISTFGDINLTGKPSNEITRGKRNSVLSSFFANAPTIAQQKYKTILRGSDSDETKIARALIILRESNVSAKLEEEIARCVERAHAALSVPVLADSGRVLLTHLTEALTNRQS